MQKMGLFARFGRSFQRRLMIIFGAIKFFKYPPILVFDPGSYAVSGRDCRSLLSVLQPGDILLRGYVNFIDGWFIRRSIITDPKGPKQIWPGTFTHAAIFVGPLNEDRIQDIAANLQGYSYDTGEAPSEEELRIRIEAERSKYRDSLQQDNQMVVHAMGDGVKIEDILTFTRCDQLVVLRLPEKLSCQTKSLVDTPKFAAAMRQSSKEIEQALLRDETIDRDKVVQDVIKIALGKVGSEYDFACNDTKVHHYFSCSELVYFCFASVRSFLAVQCWEHAFLKLYPRRVTITPDDYLYTQLELVWHSTSLNQWKETTWKEIRANVDARKP